MRKLGWMAAVATAAVLLAAPAAQAGYSAIAAGVNGYGQAEGYPTMDAARNAAVADCRRHGGGSCSESVAEDDNWFFAAAICDGSPYAGASGVSPGRAKAVVWTKAGMDENDGRCHFLSSF